MKEYEGVYEGLTVVAVNEIEKNVGSSDLVVTMTSTRIPYLKEEWVKRNAMVIQMDPNELLPEVLTTADRLVTDSWEELKMVEISIIKIIQQINENVVFTAPSISQRAAIYALRFRSKIQPEMIDEYRKRVFYAAERINAIPNMHVIYPPKGSFYLFINIKDTGLTSTQVANSILADAHVLMLPGSAFGTCGEGFLRIACTVKIDTLKIVFDRIEKMELFRKESF